jgi:hypothetical protein
MLIGKGGRGLKGRGGGEGGSHPRVEIGTECHVCRLIDALGVSGRRTSQETHGTEVYHLLQGYARVLQGSYNGITSMLQGCCKGVTRVLQR